MNSLKLILALMLLSTSAQAAPVTNYRQGVEAHRRGQLEAAQAAFRAALQESPGDAGLYANLAAVLIDRGQPAKAASVLSRATTIDPQDARLRAMHGRALLATGKPEFAAEQYAIAASLEPSQPLLQLYHGQALMQAGQHAAARNVLEQAAERLPRHPEVLEAWAESLLRSGARARSVSVLRDLLARQPSNDRARRRLAKVLLEIGDYTLAEKEFGKLLSEGDPRPEVLMGLAQAQAAQNSLEKAIANTRRARELHPEDANIWAQLADYQRRAGRYQAATESYQWVLEISEASEQRRRTMLALAHVLEKNGKRQQAIEVLEAAREEFPRDQEASRHLAAMLLRNGDYESAAYLYSSQLGQSRQGQELYNYAASLNGSRQWQEAVGHWQRYLARHPEQGEAWFNLSVAQSALGNDRKALSALAKARQAGFEESKLLRLKARLKSGKEAGKIYEQLLQEADSSSQITSLNEAMLSQADADLAQEALEMLRASGSREPVVLAEIARLAQHLDKSELAEDTLRRWLSMEPESLDALLALADLLAEQGRLAAAGELYGRASELDPDNFHAQYNYALALGQQGKNGQAIEEYREALELRPNYPDTHYALGALLLSGDEQAAATHWQKYLDLAPSGDFAEAVRERLPDLRTKVQTSDNP